MYKRKVRIYIYGDINIFTGTSIPYFPFHKRHILFRKTTKKIILVPNIGMSTFLKKISTSVRCSLQVASLDAGNTAAYTLVINTGFKFATNKLPLC